MRRPANDHRPVPVPAPRCGIGLRAPHQRDLLESLPSLGLVEVHSENYFGAGGPALHYLERTREHYAVSLHGIGLSLGSADPLDPRHIASLAHLVRRIDPLFVSDHLCWCSVGGIHAHDLLPLPYTEEALALVVNKVDAVQTSLGRRLLLENPSSYLRFRHSTIPEWEFLPEVARRTGCGVLLDVNNVWVSACNHGWSAPRYLEQIPERAVAEIHLAGHLRREVDGCEILIDTHDRPVSEPVWALYRQACLRFGNVPAVVEWDADLPPLDTLLLEAARADRIASEARHALAA